MGKKGGANPRGYIGLSAIFCLVGGIYLAITQGLQPAWIPLLIGVGVGAWVIYDVRRQQRPDDS